MLQETQGGGRKWRCSMEMGFWGSAPKFCAGRQEQVTAQVIVLGLCAEYSPKLFPELMWSVCFLAIGGQEKYQVFGELLKKCFMHNLSFEVLLKLMSSLVVSLSSIFHSECKPEKNLAFKLALTGKSFCLQEFNHPSVFEGWRKDGTKSIVTWSTGGEIITASRPWAVAGGECTGFLCLSNQD